MAPTVLFRLQLTECVGWEIQPTCQVTECNERDFKKTVKILKDSEFIKTSYHFK